MKYQRFLSIFLLFLLLISSVSAFMPTTHKLITKNSLSNAQESEVYRSANKYPELTYTGNILTDISVIWYWTEGTKYAVTHEPNFCRALLSNAKNEQEIACAVGGCIHQAQDIVSHNNLVPFSITHTGLSNFIIHVFAEQKVDNWVVDSYPGIKAEALNELSDFETCVPLFKRSLLGNEEYSDISAEKMDDLFEKFIYEIQTSQTGYDTAFKDKSVAVNFKAIPFSVIAGFSLIMLFFFVITLLMILKIFKKQATARHYIGLAFFLAIFLLLAYVFISNAQGSAFKAVITIATPISNFVPIGASAQSYVNQAVTNTNELLNQGEIWLENSEASGFTSLDTADRRIIWFDYILLTVIVVLLGLYTWYLIRKNKVKVRDTFDL